MVHMGQHRPPRLQPFHPIKHPGQMRMARMWRLAQAADNPNLNASQRLERCFVERDYISRICESAEPEAGGPADHMILLERHHRYTLDRERALDDMCPELRAVHFHSLGQ